MAALRFLLALATLLAAAACFPPAPPLDCELDSDCEPQDRCDDGNHRCIWRGFPGPGTSSSTMATASGSSGSVSRASSGSSGSSGGVMGSSSSRMGSSSRPASSSSSLVTSSSTSEMGTSFSLTLASSIIIITPDSRELPPSSSLSPPSSSAGSSSSSAASMGQPGMVALDFNGDGQGDFAAHDRTTGTFHVFGPSTVIATDDCPFSPLGMVSVMTSPDPLIGSSAVDFDGDGMMDVVAFYRTSAGVAWAGRSVTGSGQISGAFMNLSSTAQPSWADFDADGLWDPGVFDEGVWTIAPAGGTRAVPFGVTGDVPAPGRYFRADTIARIVVVRPATNDTVMGQATWFEAENPATLVFDTFGGVDDQVMVADYDGDGFIDVAMWRPSSAQLFVHPGDDAADVRVLSFPAGLRDVFPCHAGAGLTMTLCTMDVGASGNWQLNIHAAGQQSLVCPLGLDGAHDVRPLFPNNTSVERAYR